MQNMFSDNSSDDIDTSLLASLIIEFNISRRFFKAYPAEHPMVKASSEKVISRYERLLGSNEDMVIAVAKDALMVESGFLDKSSQIFRDFAGVLFERGIGALIMRAGLTVAELKIFNTILGLKREEIAAHGGIEALWGKARLSSLGIRAIRYDLFSATEGNILIKDNIKGLWERFARGLINSTLGYGPFSDEGFDPHRLAQMLNKRYQEVGENHSEDFVEMLQQAEYRPEASRRPRIAYQQIAEFVVHLKPELRQHFLSASFDIRTIEGNIAAEEIISCMSSRNALKTLEEFKRNNTDVPATILRLLEKLVGSPAGTHEPETINLLQQDPFEAKMRLIFSEHSIEEQHMAANLQISPSPAPTEIQAGSDQSEPDMLISTLEPSNVEYSIGEIILRLAGIGSDPLVTENLAQNLAEMCSFVLQTGDYHQLHKLIRQASDSALPPAFRSLLAERFSQRDFMDEILNGLTIWGKNRFQDIRLLIDEIGAPFIEPLLDRLASEENMSLRRFIMDRIQEFGPAAKNSMLLRLNDGRWYYLRNLMIMLNSFDDPELAPHIRPLLKHENSKVRQDALLILLNYHDPIAERQLSRDLDSSNEELRMVATNASKKSHSKEVLNKLLALISQKGLSQTEVELKSAVINSLKEIGRIEALPVLTKFLGTSNLLRARALTKLKLDVVRSFESYPPQAVVPILMKFAGGSDELARQAAESMRNIRMKSNEP